jgi:hypothetical protein
MGFFARIALFIRIMVLRWHQTGYLVSEARHCNHKSPEEILLPLFIGIDKMPIKQYPALLSEINKLGRTVACHRHAGGANRNGEVWSFATIMFANGTLAEVLILKAGDADKAHFLTYFTTPNGVGAGHVVAPDLLVLAAQ